MSLNRILMKYLRWCPGVESAGKFTAPCASNLTVEDASGRRTAGNDCSRKLRKEIFSSLRRNDSSLLQNWLTPSSPRQYRGWNHECGKLA